MSTSIPKTTREYRLPKNEGFQSLTLGEGPVPAVKSSEVLLKVHAVSLQFRDLVVAQGKYPLGMKENVVPGSDMAGTIVAVGDGVQNWKQGDRVCANFAVDHIDGDVTPAIKATGLGAPIDGVLREYIVVPVHSLVKIPQHLSFEEASTLPCAALTAYNALYGPKPLKAGDVVLAIGSGGVSIFAVQFALAAGAEVIAFTSSSEKMEKLKALGATHVINYKEVQNWEENVREITGGRGVDHVIEVGGAGTLNKSLASVRMAGYIHVIGFVAGGGDVGQVPGMLVSTAAILRGILIGSVAQFNDMNRMITANKIRPVVDRVFDFENLQEAYQYLASQKHVGKVVVKVARD